MHKNYFSSLILKWFDQFGRKNLPWQILKTPYRVWISEIMLQQTQVKTVIPYYENFLSRFPDVKTLAKAKEDEVLHLWSGLGYYTRARCLLKAAQWIVNVNKGIFPSTVCELEKLPGIGRSTAGAIAAIAFDHKNAILDGNVKRVLARYYGIQNAIDEADTVTQLWKYAELNLPNHRIADYTQAMMDLGATVCTRRNPECNICPLAKKCIARLTKRTAVIPVKKLRKILPCQTATFLVIKNASNHLLLEKRRKKGVWKGLWCFPEYAGNPDTKAIKQYCKKNLHFIPKQKSFLDPFRHTFTHYHLDIYPLIIELSTMPKNLISNEFTAAEKDENNDHFWYNPNIPSMIGIPKPVEKIIKMLGVT